MPQNCAVCDGEGTHRCSACRQVFYCSFAHQKKDWKNHRKCCSPIMILKDDPAESTPYWVAGRDVKAGSSILKESPALRWPAWPPLEGNSNKLRSVPCLSCGKFMQVGGQDFYQCTTCHWPVCNSECEKAVIHASNECEDFAAHNIKLASETKKNLEKVLDYAIGLIRLNKLKERDPKKYEDIIRLSAEPQVIYDTRHLAFYHEVLMRFSCFLANRNNQRNSYMTYPELRHASWVLKLNRLSSSREVEIGSPGAGGEKYGMFCIYLKASLLSKSCIPNCSQSPNLMPPEFNMMVRMAVNVKKGDRLTLVRHGGDALPTVQRQLEFRQQFQTTCRCPRCVDPTELGTFMSAIICPACRNIPDKPEKTGLLLPVDPTNISDTAPWKCNRCGVKVGASECHPDILNLADEITLGLDKLEYYEEVILENSGVYLHPNHWVLQLTTSSILDHFQENGCRLEQVEHFTKLTLYRLCIEDALNPGISYMRSTFQRDYLMVMWPVIKKCMNANPEWALKTLHRQIDLCRCFIKQCLQYFDHFQGHLFQGENTVNMLMEIKTGIEKIISNKEGHSGDDEQQSNLIMQAD